MNGDFESALKRALETHGGNAPNLLEAMSYSLLAGGKRIRPRLALASSKMVGIKSEAALAYAVAIEMIHCFTLIHDDLPCMDNDDFRRGQPANHKKYGDALALLAGDALVPLAIDVFTEAAAYVSSRGFFEGLKRFLNAAGPRGVIGGQASELMLTPKSTLEELYKVHRGKTGALFEASLLVPRDFAEIHLNDPKSRSLDHFAHAIGFGFQVADDLEDSEDKPTSVLYHLSREQAQSDVTKALSAAISDLRSSWGESALLLVEIAQEVLTKLSRNS